MVKWIKLPIEILCYCTESGTEMTVEVSDPEIPTYLAKCPKCNAEIILSFGDFITKDQDKKT